MAKQRYIDTKFWDDSYIIKLDPTEKLLFLYLLTNTLTNIAGIYEISLKRVAFDTGIDSEMVTKILLRLESDSKAYYIDGWLILTNFPKYQKHEKSPKIKDGIDIIIKNLPDNIKESIHTLSIPYLYPLNYPNPNLNLNLNPNTNRAKKIAQKIVLPEVEEMILKYIPIKDIKNKTNQGYLKRLYCHFGQDLKQVELLCRGYEYFQKSEYPYVIYSVRSLYEKREKIMARIEQEKLKVTNKKSKWHVI